MQVYIIESFFYYEYFDFSVNLVFEQQLIGNAAMGADPQEPAWNASKAIDGNVSQDYKSNSCAITNVEKNRNTSIWWKVWLEKKFNVAYIEIYFRSDSKYLTFFKSVLIGNNIHISICMQYFYEHFVLL